MAAWNEVCRQCVSTVANVPIEILLVAALATLLGLFVLVSIQIPARSAKHLRSRHRKPQ